MSVNIVTMVGSRNILPMQRDLFMALGKHYCDSFCQFRSGLAEGSDLASFIGFKASFNYNPELASNYVVKHRWFHDEYAKGTVKPLSMFSSKLVEEARKLVFEARGSFHGLSEYAEMLHTRNAFQVLGDDLQTPSELLILCSEPIWNKEETYSKVKGGTNTAFRIARKFNIPYLNLSTNEDYTEARLTLFEEKKETSPSLETIQEYENIIQKHYQRK